MTKKKEVYKDFLTIPKHITYRYLISCHSIAEFPEVASEGYRAAYKGYAYDLAPRIEEPPYKTADNIRLWIMGWYCFFGYAFDLYKVRTKFKRLEK